MAQPKDAPIKNSSLIEKVENESDNKNENETESSSDPEKEEVNQTLSQNEISSKKVEIAVKNVTEKKETKVEKV